jgi:hypothetical protein
LSLKKAELVRQLAEKGLSTEGLKPELVERLTLSFNDTFEDAPEQAAPAAQHGVEGLVDDDMEPQRLDTFELAEGEDFEGLESELDKSGKMAIEAKTGNVRDESEELRLDGVGEVSEYELGEALAAQYGAGIEEEGGAPVGGFEAEDNGDMDLIELQEDGEVSVGDLAISTSNESGFLSAVPHAPSPPQCPSQCARDLLALLEENGLSHSTSI